jgi:hypothetical protein
MNRLRTSRHWFKTRFMRLVGLAVVGLVLCAWYADLRSDQTEAWLSAGGTHGTWAAVFLMGLAVGSILGALCTPVVTDLIKRGEKR